MGDHQSWLPKLRNACYSELKNQLVRTRPTTGSCSALLALRKLRLLYTGPDLEPLEIGSWLGGDFVDPCASHWNDRLGHDPAMRFNMAIHKGKIHRTVVVRAWHIAPHVIIQTVHEKSII